LKGEVLAIGKESRTELHGSARATKHGMLRASTSRNGFDRSIPAPVEEGARRERVPLTRMDGENPELLNQILGAVGDVARRGQFVLGEEVERFESEFARYCDAQHAVGVSSGTDALVLALRALEIGPGDEVVLPANSFIATAEAVTLVGATPRFADVDPLTHTVTLETLEPAITARTTAVIVVHLYGRTVEMQPILEHARRSGLRVVEDACQAHGARYRGRRVGALGDIGCFSFYPAKNLGAWGDGGAVTTNCRDLAERVALLRSHGEHPRYQHNVVGTTARLDAIQAAVLRIKLPLLDGWNDDRRRLASDLTRGLIEAPVTAPIDPAPGNDHVFHQYVVTSPDREGLREHLERIGVSSAVHYPTPIHLSPAYRETAGDLPLGVAEWLAEHVCSLPIFPSMDDQAVARVIDAVREFDHEPVEAAA
jgi:dTDP-3-amino-3,4,6-trideoxy-alpha-D-glucose transaminase